MDKYLIRDIEYDDYHRGHIDLLNQLSPCDDHMSKELYDRQLSEILKTSKCLVIEIEGRIAASGSVFIEHKLIHNCGKVGHIEDVVIDREHRRKGYGKLIVSELVEYAKINGCYKVILSCSDKNKSFYEPLGFSKRQHEMSIYFGADGRR